MLEGLTRSIEMEEDHISNQILRYKEEPTRQEIVHN